MIRTTARALALSLALAGSAHAADSYPRLATCECRGLGLKQAVLTD